MALTAAAAAALGAGAQAAGNLLGNTLNYFGVQSTNTNNYGIAELNNWANMQIAERTNKLNEKLQREQWSRDDSAYQRMVADVSAAGLNPLSSFSSPENSGLSAQMQGASLNAPSAIAPNFDFSNMFSGLVDAALKQEQLNQTNKMINLKAITSGVSPDLLDDKSNSSDVVDFFKSLFEANLREAQKNANSPYVKGEGTISRAAKDIGQTFNYLLDSTNNYISKKTGKPVDLVKDIPASVKGVKVVDSKDTDAYRKDVQAYYYNKAKKNKQTLPKRFIQFLRAKTNLGW